MSQDTFLKIDLRFAVPGHQEALTDTRVWLPAINNQVQRPQVPGRASSLRKDDQLCPALPACPPLAWPEIQKPHNSVHRIILLRVKCLLELPNLAQTFLS